MSHAIANRHSVQYSRKGKDERKEVDFYSRCPHLSRGVREVTGREPANPAKLATMFRLQGEYYIDNNCFDPQYKENHYDPSYQGCRMESMQFPLERWMKEIVKNPKEICNPYLEDQLHRIFQVPRWDVRSLVTDLILPYLNKELTREILRSRRDEDEEDIGWESDCTIERNSMIETGPERRCYASRSEITDWEKHGRFQY